MITVFIVDDERLAREELKLMIENIGQIEIVGEAQDAISAKAMLSEIKPDILLLDISMPEKSGFDLLEELDHVPHVIFTTAYDEFALKAFEVNAFDYLLKPIPPDRLSRALDKARQHIEQERKLIHAIPTDVIPAERQIFIKDGEKCYFIKLSEIFLIRSYGAYAKLYFGNQAPLIHRSMNALEERLDPDVFFRANRKEIINLKFVDKINAYFKGGMQVTLKNGEAIEISTRRSVKFKESLSL